MGITTSTLVSFAGAKTRCVFVQSLRAIPMGSIPALLHHEASSPDRCTVAMMAAAQRDDEFVAHLAPERRGLREPQVMGVRGPPAANQARLLGNRFDVIAVKPLPPNPARHQDLAITQVGPCPLRPRATSCQLE